MKVLILTVSAGEGHNTISRALAANLGDGAEIITYDIYKGKSKFYSKLVNDVYFFVCKHFMSISNWLFERQKKRDPKKNQRTIVHKITRKAKPRVKELLDEFKPDAVFCAHVYCAHIMSDLRAQGATDAKIFTVVSDYDVSPYFETALGVDYIVAPNPDFDDVLLYKGFKKEQILHLGIPVEQRFSVELDKAEMRAKFHLHQDKFTVLMMNGGVGFGNTKKLIKNLAMADVDIQIISVCGRNKKLKRDIDKLILSGKLNKKILNLGFVDNVHELMSAADVLVGKLGGLSSTEAFHKGLPIIATRKLPWQEYDNMLYLTKKGVCDYINRDKDAYKILERLVKTEGLYNERVQNVKAFRKQDSVQALAAAIKDSIAK